MKNKIKLVLWILVFPLMLWLLIFKSKKITKKNKTIILAVYSVLLIVTINLPSEADGSNTSQVEKINGNKGTIEVTRTRVSPSVEKLLIESKQQVKTEREIEDNVPTGIDSSSTEGKTSKSIVKTSQSNQEHEIELDGEMSIYFLDVGQGLSVYIKDSNGNDIVYDAGNKSDSQFLIEFLNSQGVDDIELLVASHYHEDHIGGMNALLKTYKIENFLYPDGTYTSNTYKDMMFTADNKNINQIIAESGQEYRFGDLFIDIYRPSNGKLYENQNDMSVAMEVTFGENSILLVGDGEVEAEHELVSLGDVIQADILQVGHHGSATSSTAQFIYKVDPTVAVISCGLGNEYGHPDKLVTDRLTNMSISTFRTDESGTVVIVCDGEGVPIINTFSDLGNPDNKKSTNNNVSNEKVIEKNNTKETLADIEPLIGGIQIEVVDKKAEYVVIKNNTVTTIDITGWILLSEKGDQSFTFPEGSVLASGKSFKITSSDANGSGDFSMAKGDVWNNKKPDPAVLFNSSRVEIDRY